MQIVLTIFRVTCPNHMQIVVTSVSIWIGIGYRVRHSLIYCNFWNHICHRKTNWTCFIGKVGFEFHRMPIMPIECRFSKFKLQLYENFKMQWIPLHNSCVCAQLFTGILFWRSLLPLGVEKHLCFLFLQIPRRICGNSKQQ